MSFDTDAYSGQFHFLTEIRAEDLARIQGCKLQRSCRRNQNPPVVFGNNDKMIWKLLLPEGHSSPCIWGDNIFLTGFNKEGKKLRMFCIDRKKGTIKWEKELTIADFEKVNPDGGYFSCFNAADGRIFYRERLSTGGSWFVRNLSQRRLQ